MGFKLVRVDAIEPCKVSLPLGSHFIGRGQFLDCHDQRVSRQHAELIVTSDSILINSLHQNPCYYKNKSSKETIIFCQTESQVLSNGDQFGLLPDSFWYEVIYCLDNSPTDTESVQTKEKAGNDQNGYMEKENQEETNMNENSNTDSYEHDGQEKVNYTSDSVAGEGSASPSLLPPENTPTPTDNPEDMDLTSVDQLVELVESVESTNQGVNVHKREHSQEGSPCDQKKVKTEPEESSTKDIDDGAETSNQPVKVENTTPQDFKPEPGPSNVQGCSSNSGNNNAPAMPQSPTKQPNKPLRERCMYGAKCYRRNPQHKATFSHPADSDWGAGERAECPWGEGCQRPDPRHWRDHTHPPGTVQPPPRHFGNRPGMQLVRRNGNNFFINANSVHFYDDHFEVEDSDGDSVDYDYEF